MARSSLLEAFTVLLAVVAGLAAGFMFLSVDTRPPVYTRTLVVPQKLRLDQDSASVAILAVSRQPTTLQTSSAAVSSKPLTKAKVTTATKAASSALTTADVPTTKLSAGQDIARYEQTTTLANLANHPCAGMVLWKRCIYATCDAHPSVSERDDTRSWNVQPFDEALEQFRARKETRPFRIFLVTRQVSAFMSHSWPAFNESKTRFVVVLGASTMPVSQLGTLLDQLLASPYLVQAFACNSNVKHPRLTQIALGVDYHAIASTTLPAEQNAELLSYTWQHNQARTREFKVLANFRITTNPGARRHVMPQLLKHLPEEYIRQFPLKTPRSDIWNATAHAEFMVSPPGRGMDCHRHWEIMALGAIAIIVHNPPFTDIYDELPVVQVRNYEDVTLDNLTRWRDEYRPRMQAFIEARDEKLFATYSMRQVLATS